MALPYLLVTHYLLPFELAEKQCFSYPSLAANGEAQRNHRQGGQRAQCFPPSDLIVLVVRVHRVKFLDGLPDGISFFSTGRMIHEGMNW
jgi:hypothetical protein